MNSPIYLDYAATTPVDPAVSEVMMRYLGIEGVFGNPASRSHRFGWQAEQAVELARKQVASLVHCDPREVVWTSGATESNNLAIKGVCEFYRDQAGSYDKKRHLVTSSIEHKAVLDTCKYLESQGYEVTYLKPDEKGIITLEQVEEAVRSDTLLVSLMHVNNEIGVINPIHAIGDFLRKKGVWFHVDAAQSLGKVHIDLTEAKIDLMSFSAHKVYGPKGVGALYVNRHSGIGVACQMHGGGHERGFRSGTLATHQLAGFGMACAVAKDVMVEEEKRLRYFRELFRAQLTSVAGLHFHGDWDLRVAGNVNLGVEGVDGEVLLMSLQELAVSSGSACTSASVEPSYVLKAIGASDAIALSSIRITFGRFTEESEVVEAAQIMEQV
ncbi:MAG: IscS subfamily cysteine desulfurase, partial [Pseudomonadales bacterium]|nr:IscS subfamily cysteine desulfurase [Pseudomonadales bacterium]